MIYLVKGRLVSLGYEVTEGDTFALDFELSKELDFVNSECGRIPDELKYNIVDWVVANFLLAKKNAGGLGSLGNEEFSQAPLKSLTDGDVRREWGGSSSTGVKTLDERIDELVANLLKSRSLIALYRIVKW